MKTCTKCLIDKTAADFAAMKASPDGLQYNCKSCNAAYYRNNRKKIVENRKEKPKNKEEMRKKRRERYENNRENQLEKSRKYYEKVYRTPEYKARMIFLSCRSRSNRWQSFDLTYEWVLEKIKKGVCEKTGIVFDMGKKGTKRNLHGPSIDRIDNNKGYTTDNCQIVCNMYNTGKGQHTDLEFLDFCKKVVEFNSR